MRVTFPAAVVTMLLGASMLTACASRPEPRADLAIADVSVVTMANEQILEHRNVLVRAGRIAAITAASVKPPEADRIIDGRGKFLVPGLIDVHVHLTKENPEANVRSVEALLGYGVTTALVLHGREGHLQLRDEIARGTRLGPRLLVSTRNLNVSDLTTSAGEALARESKPNGYDFIKVYDRISPDGFAGIALAASEIGMPLVGHVPKKVGLEASLKQGLIRIVHAEELLYNEPFHYRTNPEIPLSVLDETKIPDVVRLLVDHRAMLSPTLIAYQTIIDASERPEAMRARALGNVPSFSVVEEWRPFIDDGFYPKKFATEESHSRLRRAFEFQKTLVLALQRAGVPIVAGTDSPMFGYQQVGSALHDELAIYRDLGMSNFDALSTATRNGAAYLLQSDTGTIEPGKRADLLLLDDNPLLGLDALRDIEYLVLGGVPVPRERLEGLTRPD